MFTPRDAARSGSALLDRHQPGWYRLINPATLNIASGRDCICGQLFGGFGEGLTTLSMSALDAANATSFGM